MWPLLVCIFRVLKKKISGEEGGVVGLTHHGIFLWCIVCSMDEIDQICKLTIFAFLLGW
jgi:hypothetical protein